MGTKMNTIKEKLLITTVGLLAFATTGCTNPETPAGHEGYVYYVPLVFGKMEAREPLTGPASTGISWRLFVSNIDMRARNFKEPFELLTLDNLNVIFEVNTRIRLRQGSVKQIVEEWGGEHWYENNVKEPLRTVVRRQVMRVSASAIQLKTNMVRDRIREDLLNKFKGKPVQIETVDIGHIEFPKEVTDAIEHKESKQQELERQEFILAKAHKEAAIRVLEALKVAKEQQIISSTLDPLYVQRRAVEVYRSLAKSPNKTMILLPNTADGTGMPLVMTEGRRKVLTDDGRKLLEKMESKYMEIARADAKIDEPIPGAPAPPKTEASAPEESAAGDLDNKGKTTKKTGP